MQVFSTIFRFDFISSPSDFTFKLVNLYYALSCSKLFSLNSNLNLLQVRSVVIVLFFRFPPSSLLLFLCLFRFLSFCIVFFLLYFSISLHFSRRLRIICLKSFGKYKSILFITFSVTVLPVIVDSVRNLRS